MSHSTHLRILEASGLVSLVNVLPEVEYLFRHTLIQEAAYGSLLKSDRQALHRITGSVLEDIYREREEEIAPILAGHFYAASDYERALRYFTISGDKAMEIYAIPEAIEHYKYALDIAKRDRSWQNKINRLFSQLGIAYELNAQYNQALECYRDMESLANENRDEAMRLAGIIARAKVYATPSAVHDADRAQKLSNLALELAEKIGDRTSQARIHWILGLLYARTGKFIDSIVHHEQALALARKLDHKELMAYTLNDVSQPYVSTYQFEKGYQALKEAQSLWRSLGNLPMLVDNLSTLIAYDYFNGEYDPALAKYQEAAALSESIGNLWGQAYCRMYVGDIYFDRGHPEEAIQLMKQCIQLAEEAGFIVPLLQTQAELGYIYAYLGDIERGLATIDKALINRSQEIVGWGAWALAIKARVHAQRNEFEEARKLMQNAEKALQQGDPLGFARIVLQGLYCELALAEKDYPRALEISQLFETEVITDIRLFTPWLYYMRGVTLLETGQHADAHDALTKALEHAENMHSRIIIWQVQAALAELADRQGKSDQSRQHRALAREIINYIAARTGSEELRESFLNRKDVIALRESQ